MPVSKPQLLEVPLADGLSQKYDRRSGPSTSANLMTNCVRLKNGAVRKRFGHTALSKSIDRGGSMAAATAGGAYRNMAWMADASLLYTYSDAAGLWDRTNRVSEVAVLDRLHAGSAITNIVDYDIGYANGYLLVVYVAGTAQTSVQQIFYAVFDVSGSTYANAGGPTLATVVPPSAIAGAVSLSAVKLIMCGTTAVVLYQSNGSKTILGARMDMTNPTALFAPTNASVTVGSTVTIGVWDASAIAGDATRFALVYETANAANVRLEILQTSNFASLTTKDFEAKANFNTIASFSLNATNLGHYWIGYVATAGAAIIAGAPQMRATFWNETGNISATPVTIFTYAATAAIGKQAIAVNATAVAYYAISTGEAAGQAAMGTAFVRIIGISDVATVPTATGTVGILSDCQLACRPWVVTRTAPIAGDTLYFAAVLPSTVQGTHALIAFDVAPTNSLRTCAIFAPRLTKTLPQPMVASFTLAHAPLITGIMSGSVYAVPIIFSVSTFHSTVAVEFADLAPPGARIGVALGTNLFLSAGLLTMFDGGAPSEGACISYPELPAPTPSGAGGAMATGTYQYIATYEWRDSNGNIMRSATSPAVSVAVTGPTGSVTMSVPLLNMLARPLPINLGPGVNGQATPLYAVVVYRTTANGTLFYRVTSDPPTTTAIFQTPTGTAFVLAFSDTASDATLTASATAQLLYTTGGVLDNFCPASARCIVVHKSRLFVAGCDEPTQVWPSKAFTSGEIPGFNEAIAFSASGAVRALASLDDKLVMFVQRGTQFGIDYITGDGPTDIGTQSDWAPPQQVMSDVGAIDQRGTCAGPFGILFRSPVGGPNGSGGLYVLTRDLQVRYVSAAVEDTLQANPVVTSMVLHPNTGRVYVTCVPSDYGFTSGVRLVWDYTNGGIWSQDQMFDADTSQTSAGARAGFVANTSAAGLAYHWVTATGRVYRETNGIGANSYTDAGTWVTMTVASSWQKLAMSGVAQYWAVQLQSDSLDPSDLTVQLTFDYAASGYSESKTWTAGAQASFDRFPQVDVEMTPHNQTAKAIQVQLSDAAPTGGAASTTGQGASWATLTIEIGPDEGRYPNLPPAQRA